MCIGTPKVPKPTPVIERQPYKDPVPRSALLAANPDVQRLANMGVVGSAQGDLTTASTTKRVALGGDQQLAPVLGGSPTGGVTTPSTPDTSPVGVGGGNLAAGGNPTKKKFNNAGAYVASMIANTLGPDAKAKLAQRMNAY